MDGISIVIPDINPVVADIGDGHDDDANSLQPPPAQDTVSSSSAPPQGLEGAKHCTISASVALTVLAVTVIVLLLALGGAVWFYGLNPFLRELAFETGENRIDTAVALVREQINGIERSVLTYAEVIELHPQLDISSSAGFLDFYNRSIFPAHVADINANRQVLGLAVAARWIATDVMQYPNVFWETRLNGARRQLFAFSDPTSSNDIIHVHTVNIGNRTQSGFSRSRRTITVSPRLISFPGSLQKQLIKNITQEDLTFLRISPWITTDLNIYHFATIIKSFTLDGVRLSVLGWIEASDLLRTLGTNTTHHQPQTDHGQMLIVDNYGRALATTDRAAQAAFREYLVNTTRLRDPFNTSSGLVLEHASNHPTPWVREVYAAVKDFLVFNPDMPSTRQSLTLHGESHFAIVRGIVDRGELQLALVWIEHESELITPSFQRIRYGAIGVVAILVITSVMCMILTSFMLARPIRRIEQQLVLLSQLDETVTFAEDLSDNYRIAEVASLYRGFNWVKNTVRFCLPYLPRNIAGDESPNAESLSEIGSFSEADFSSVSFQHQSINISKSLVLDPNSNANGNPLSSGPSMRRHASMQRFKEEVQHCDVVVCHIDLHPRLRYAELSESEWKDLTVSFHQICTKFASTHKGNILAINISNVTIVWHAIVSPEKKALYCAHDIHAAMEEKLWIAKWSVSSLPSAVFIGVSANTGLVGVVGTNFKKNFTCSSIALPMAAMYASVAAAVHAPIVTSTRISEGNAIFAEFRPVDMIDFPKLESCVSTQRPFQDHVFQVVQIYELSGSAGDQEWMYTLDKQEKDKKTAPTRELYLKAYTSLTEGKLQLARSLFAQLISQNSADVFLRRKQKVLSLYPATHASGVPTDQLQDVDDITDEKNSSTSSTTESAQLASASPELVAFFDLLAEGKISYPRPASVTGVQLYPFEPVSKK